MHLKEVSLLKSNDISSQNDFRLRLSFSEDRFGEIGLNYGQEAQSVAYALRHMARIIEDLESKYRQPPNPDPPAGPYRWECPS